MASCTADWQLEQQYSAKFCIIKVVWWSCAVCDLVSAPWWLSWPQHIHWAPALGGNVLITEPCLPLPLHFSLLVSFSTESAPSSYSVMRNDNPSSAKYYTWREVSSLSLWTMVRGCGGGENCRATHRHCQTICKESSIRSFNQLTIFSFNNLWKVIVSELSSSLSERQDIRYLFI